MNNKITSVNNPWVKDTVKLLQKKFREESGLFLIEGQKGIEEALNSGIEIVRLFSTEGFEGFSSRIETTEAVLSKISDAKSPPKAIAVAKQPKYDSKRLEKMKRVVLLEGIKDAGNLGTIIRSATAFGMDAIVLYGDTVDLFNPKCVRSSVGNLWKIPVYKLDDLSILTSYERIATLPKADNVINLEEYKLAEKILMMFGSEADGLSEELKSFATKRISIEMNSTVESLNLSISAGIFMYKLR